MNHYDMRERSLHRKLFRALRRVQTLTHLAYRTALARTGITNAMQPTNNQALSPGTNFSTGLREIRLKVAYLKNSSSAL